MPDNFILLVREVERLVTAPYVPSLQDLYDTVRDTPSTVLAAWASCKPCQVGLLVDVLVEGLSRSSIALELLCTFGSVKAARDALLERYPAILDQFLEQALENGHSEYIPTCVAILSSPLPENFISPARLSPFILSLINRMGESPSGETISPLYKLMTGLQSSPGVLNEIPCETMATFQTELTRTLRNLEDHMGNLLCLATFARIANADIQHGPQPPSWLENIQHFFDPKRGLKTLDLVVLRVILACSARCSGLSVRNAAESVRLAIEVCDRVDTDRKQAWIAANSSKIAKLCEKVTREGIDHEVQLMGITFLVSLLPATALPPEIPRMGFRALVSMDSIRVLEMVPSELIPRLVEVTVVPGQKSAVDTFLKYVYSALEAECPMEESNTMATIRLASLFLTSLRKLNSRPSGPAVPELAPSMDTNTLLDIVGRFPRQLFKSQCDGSITCHTEVSLLQNQLLVDLIDFYSHVSVAGNMDGNISALPKNVLAVFMTQVRKGLSGAQCDFTAQKAIDFRSSVPLPTIRDKSPSTYPGRDWRAGIAETLSLNARDLHENMMKTVQEACHDLETRCYDTEAPLRAVEEERDRSRIEAEELRQQKTELEGRLNQGSTESEQVRQEKSELERQVHEASRTISDLQNDIRRLEEYSENASSRVEELTLNLDAARKELEDQRRNSEEAAEQEREKARTKELDMFATITEKDDQLEELQGEIDEQRAENEEVRKTLDAVSKEKASSLENCVSLRQEIARLNEHLESCRHILAEKDDEVTRLLADKESAKVESEALQKKLGEAATEYSHLKSAACDTEKNLKNKIKTLKQQHELQLGQANANTTKQKEANESLEAAMHAAASNANKELQSKDRKIQRLVKKLQSLQEEQAAKARESSEAQQHIERLMNVMGFHKNPMPSRTPSKHRSTLNPVQRAETPQKIHSDEPDEADTPTQADNPLAESFESTASSPAGGSSKRPRGTPISSSQDVTPVPPRSISSQKTKTLPTRTRNGQQQKRNPLGDGDQNSQRMSQNHDAKSNTAGVYFDSQVASNENENENQIQDLDLDTDLEFWKNFIFTSTCFSEGNGN
ncbi:hypothetical protein PHISCL_06093 [Aspergillus sclerotialis]|uniref:Uncharacterized protein n=1 Tax=Aspergillus sclerotialis TaxID=2070753 RepID=A0A3A2ZH24_9EURO|nr:hypothetical protein PHISCL_06093 [Aspergillus sclerotialis]